jgi:NAD(P)-dependent dehydrogenase (short-subunit alcohol dehydrogenase family)
MQFTGKTAVVTGAAKGIGRATAIGFGMQGANVALLDVDADGVQELAEEIDASGAHAMVCPVDVANRSDVRTALNAVHERFGRLDALANVAAIYPRAKVLDVTEEFWDQTLSINLRGVFFCCQEAIRIMLTQGGGTIVNVASGAAFRAIEGLAAYSASKAGVVGMSRVLAREFARMGVRVNVVAPGHTFSETFVASIADAQVDAIAESLVPGRFMTPEESANAIVWLCSDEASGVNGAIVNVNGGNYMP